MPKLYDFHGREIDLAALREERAAPTLAGIRSIWSGSAASGLTPLRLAGLLRDAADGNAYAYLTLAEEMEEKDLHYMGVLGVRKRAVSGLPVGVEAASDAAPDQKIADATREIVASPEFTDLLEDLQDAVGKGYSVCEILWDRTGKTWMPMEYKWRDPRFFVFDRVSGSEIRLLTESDPSYGEPLAPYKFLVHYPRLKTGIPLRGGIARVVSWAFVYKSYSIKDWMAFLEVFGMPLRLGKYGPSATDADISVLRAAVANLGSDAAAVIPESMRIEFTDAANSAGGNTAHKMMADWLDRQVAYGVLGQAGTTEPTPGKLGNDQAQSDVRKDIRNSDARQISNTINRHLVRAFVDLNFGPQKAYPRFVLQTAEPEDVKSLVDNVAKLVPLGLRVEQSVMRDRLNLPDPPKGETVELLGSSPVPALAANRMERLSKAVNQAGGQVFTANQQAVENLVDKVLPDGVAALEPNEQMILAAVRGAFSFDEAMAAVLALYPVLNVDALANTLTRAMVNAAAFGAWAAQEGE